MRATCPAYDRLCERFREISLVEATGALLSWDQETGIPPRGEEFRARQLEWVSGWLHRAKTSEEVRRWIEEASALDWPETSKPAANLRAWRRDYERAVRLPVKLVEELTRVTARAHHVWVRARQKSDFTAFAPALEKIVELKRQAAEAWGYEETPYDALLEGYEPGLTSRKVGELFGALRQPLETILREALDAGADLKANVLDGHDPIPQQQTLNRRVAEAFGFDFAAGRLDTSVHPFCSNLGPHDIRATTRYEERNFSVSLYGVMHEVGHGLYEQGLPEADYGLPSGEAASLGIHESQSRLWENKVGRSPWFWQAWWETASAILPGLKRFDLPQLIRVLNRAQRSFIRVEADEFTYDLHIILRFDLEKALIEGQLKVQDLPSAWNAAFERSIGLKVPDDAHGCLQDIHWSMGGFGYFPTYTLGNLYAAALFEAATQQVPEIPADLRQGRYSSLLKWLRTQVHAWGRQLSSSALLQQATGREPDIHAHLRWLRLKLEWLRGNF